VYTTEHFANEAGACSLPAADYSVTYPVALGDIASLQGIKFNSNLCGHVLKLNCGNGDVNIIVSNSNLGGGLDLYQSTWTKANGNLPAGITYCSVQLTANTIFKSTSSPVCYYGDGETTNNYYHKVGLLNTGGKIVVSAKLDNGISGSVNQFSPYFAFSSYANPSSNVIFTYDDGSTHQVPLASCLSGANKQMWS
jgi:hypothetical protein